MWNRVRYFMPGALFLMAAFALYANGLINILFIQSMYRKIYLPLFLWLAVLSYSLLAHLVFFAKLEGIALTLKRAMIFGFLFNLYIMLVDLVSLLQKDHSFLSPCYFYYIKAILLIFTFAISLRASSLIARRKEAQAIDCEIMLFAPLFASPLFFVPKLLPDRMLAVLFLVSYLAPYIAMRRNVISSLADRARGILRLFLGQDRNFVIFIFILAFIVRCFFAVNIIHKTERKGGGGFITASDDGDRYDEVAVSIVENTPGAPKVKIWGGMYDEAYAIFLASAYKLFGRNFYIVTALQSLLGSLLPVIVFLLGKTVFSRASGICAALAISLKSPIVFLSVVLGHEAIWMPLLALSIFALTRYYKISHRSYRNLAIAGIALGFVCVLRGLFIYFVPFAALWILFLWTKKAIFDRLTAIASLLAFLFMVISSVAAISGDTPNSGSTRGRAAELWETERLHDSHFKGIGNKRFEDIGVNFSRDSAGSFRKITRDPASFLVLAMKIYPLRIWAYLETYQFGFFDPIYLINSAKWPNNFSPTLEFYFTVFFLYGLILSFRDTAILKSPVFLILAFNIFVYAIVFANMGPRYKDVSTPYLYLIGSHGLVTILKNIKILKNPLSAL